MDEERLAITSLGMVTGIGHSVVTSCASLRAGLVRHADLPFSVLDESELEEVPVSGYPIRGMTEGYQGVALYKRIGVSTLKDLLKYGDLKGKEKPYWAQTGLFIAVSKARNDESGIIDDLIAAELPAGLLAGTRLPIPLNQCFMISTGHTAVIEALSLAQDFIRQRKIKRAIVLGIDSLVNEETVEYYAGLGRLKAGKTPAGLMPGEAGAAFLVETEKEAPSSGTNPPLFLGAIATVSREDNFSGETPSFGKVLSEVIVTVLKTVDPVDTVYTDLNGETLRSMDWGHALVRIQAELGYVPKRTIFPAESLGDTGAASGAVAVCAAARSYARNYATGKDCLICSTSEEGRVGALIMKSR